MRTLFLSLILFISSQAWGAEVLLSPSIIYEATRDACSQVPSWIFDSTSGRQAHSVEAIAFRSELNMGHFPSDPFNKLLDQIARQSTQDTLESLKVLSLSDSTKWVRQSEGFQRALRDCYPNSEKARLFFSKTLEAADRIGKYRGIATLSALTRGTGAAGSILARWSQTAYRTLMLSGRAFLGISTSALLTADTKKSGPQLSIPNPESLEALQKSNIESSIQMIRQFNERAIVLLAEELETASDPTKIEQLKRKLSYAQENLRSLN